jgi:hypothetical protein
MFLRVNGPLTGENEVRVRPQLEGEVLRHFVGWENDDDDYEDYEDMADFIDDDEDDD